MPKMKTNSGAGKTFRKTASGKFKRKRKLRRSTMVSESDTKRVQSMLH